MSKAAAARWFNDHLGATIDTVQTAPDGRVTWSPGPRRLTKRAGWAGWALDGSNVRITPEHTVAEVSEDRVVLFWWDEDGSLIHTTTYTVGE